MRYVFLIYQDEGTECGAKPSSDWIAVIGHGARVLGEHRLRASHAATTVRITPSGVAVADGPFAEMREPISQVCVVEMRDLDDALLAAKTLARGCAGVEIRPVWSAR